MRIGLYVHKFSALCCSKACMCHGLDLDLRQVASDPGMVMIGVDNTMTSACPPAFPMQSLRSLVHGNLSSIPKIQPKLKCVSFGRILLSCSLLLTVKLLGLLRLKR